MTLFALCLSGLFSLCGLSVQVLVLEVRHGENDDTEESLCVTRAARF